MSITRLLGGDTQHGAPTTIREVEEGSCLSLLARRVARLNRGMLLHMRLDELKKEHSTSLLANWNRHVLLLRRALARLARLWWSFSSSAVLAGRSPVHHLAACYMPSIHRRSERCEFSCPSPHSWNLGLSTSGRRSLRERFMERVCSQEQNC